MMLLPAASLSYGVFIVKRAAFEPKAAVLSACMTLFKSYIGTTLHNFKVVSIMHNHLTRLFACD